MKKYMIPLAVVAMFATAPASANDFVGIRAEATAGLDDVTGGVDPTKVTYGAAVGLDAELYKNIVVGAEATLDNVFDRRNVGAAVRVGYVVADTALIYGKVGYANWKQTTSTTLDGLRLGAGIEAKVYKSVYAKAEYRYTDFERGVGQHGGLVGVGVRF